MKLILWLLHYFTNSILLFYLQGFFPGLVQEVLVLRPSGFFQRTFTDMGFKFVKDDFKFQVSTFMYGSYSRNYI